MPVRTNAGYGWRRKYELKHQARVILAQRQELNFWTSVDLVATAAGPPNARKSSLRRPKVAARRSQDQRIGSALHGFHLGIKVG